jgi:dihydroorotase
MKDLFDRATGPLLVRGARPIAFTDLGSGLPRLDVLIGGDGCVLTFGQDLRDDLPEGTRVLDAAGSYLSPGWTDLHTHIWYGGSDFSLRPTQCGAPRGVTTLVDAGSAGEANFHGLREYVIEPAQETIYAFLNIGSIGLVACNRISELVDMRSIDVDRIAAVVEANRDRIVGLKLRASGVILGSWGLEPLHIVKKMSRVLKLPLMVHVGEPPPLYDDVVDLLEPGDIITHCFNGKIGGSILEDEALYRKVEAAAGRGVILDVGHGGASFSFEVAEAAIRRGLKPHTISTDLHGWSLDGAVGDLATTMSKLMALGMSLAEVVEASTVRPRAVIGKPSDGFLKPGTRADFTLFDVVEAKTSVKDSKGYTATLDRLFEPRRAIIGSGLVAASRHQRPAAPTGRAACPNCGWLL